MLFKFGKFWKTLCLVIGSWVFYGIWGTDLTIITLLALIVGCHFKEAQKFI
jgi:hypothetical protein